MRKSGWIGVGAVVLGGVLLTAWARGLRAQPAGGEGPASDLRPGDACTVYLRGDASGVAYHDRIADLSLLIACRGTFEHEDAQWVQVRDGSRHFAIPRSSVAAIEFGSGKPAGREHEAPANRPDPNEGGRPKLDLR